MPSALPRRIVHRRQVRAHGSLYYTSGPTDGDDRLRRRVVAVLGLVGFAVVLLTLASRQ